MWSRKRDDFFDQNAHPQSHDVSQFNNRQSRDPTVNNRGEAPSTNDDGARFQMFMDIDDDEEDQSYESGQPMDLDSRTTNEQLIPGPPKLSATSLSSGPRGNKDSPLPETWGSKTVTPKSGTTPITHEQKTELTFQPKNNVTSGPRVDVTSAPKEIKTLGTKANITSTTPEPLKQNTTTPITSTTPEEGTVIDEQSDLAQTKKSKRRKRKYGYNIHDNPKLKGSKRALNIDLASNLKKWQFLDQEQHTYQRKPCLNDVVYYTHQVTREKTGKSTKSVLDSMKSIRAKIQHCQYCNVGEDTIEEFLNHIKSEAHQEEYEIANEIKLGKLQKLFQLGRTLKETTEEEVDICLRCMLYFAGDRTRHKRHLYHITVLKERICTCKFCLVDFTNTRMYTKHTETFDHIMFATGRMLSLGKKAPGLGSCPDTYTGDPVGYQYLTKTPGHYCKLCNVVFSQPVSTHIENDRTHKKLVRLLLLEKVD